MIEEGNCSSGTRSGCCSQGRLRLAVGIGNDSGFGRGRGLHGRSARIRADSGVRFFLDADQALIGNFPAEVSVLAALLEILLEKNGTAGIGDENAGCRQKNIPSAILHFHTTTEKG